MVSTYRKFGDLPDDACLCTDKVWDLSRRPKFVSKIDLVHAVIKLKKKLAWWQNAEFKTYFAIDFRYLTMKMSLLHYTLFLSIRYRTGWPLLLIQRYATAAATAHATAAMMTGRLRNRNYFPRHLYANDIHTYTDFDVTQKSIRNRTQSRQPIGKQHQ